MGDGVMTASLPRAHEAVRDCTWQGRGRTGEAEAGKAGRTACGLLGRPAGAGLRSSAASTAGLAEEGGTASSQSLYTGAAVGVALPVGGPGARQNAAQVSCTWGSPHLALLASGALLCKRLQSQPAKGDSDQWPL
ncbi:unnamed protein product [Prorocentrum cordatum]|uniref:Subtilisin n=1 Tax=Prorocentrum cordatum TaxID=2364126 RepID=A0ABN9SB16_9DINO|nr:unnamed protein product [Polarella glacialis]